MHTHYLGYLRTGINREFKKAVDRYWKNDELSKQKLFKAIEVLPREDRDNYLKRVVDAFHSASTVVQNRTQIYSRICYSELNGIIEHIARLNADVISMDTFVKFDYPSEIGRAVYYVYSPRVPSTEEMVNLFEKTASVWETDQIWMNTDRGPKACGWEETLPSLKNMVEEAQKVQERY